MKVYGWRHILARSPWPPASPASSSCCSSSCLAGCGGDDGPGARPTPAEPPIDATLLLDFAPNAVHSGIYAATRRGLDRKAGIDLRVQVPTASTDAVRLLLGGRAQLAVLDIHDLAIARERGRDLVGVMALVQRPLAAVLADSSVRRPRDLEGRRVGVTGLPSDDAVLQSIVRGDGGDPAEVRSTTIGFNAVASVRQRPRRRRHRVLERRGRRAARADAGRAGSSASTTSARPPIPSSS